MKKSTKALIYNFICFAAIYIAVYFLISEFTNLAGLWKAVTAAVVASLLAPKFQAVNTNQGVRIFVKWLFINGVKEVK